MVTHSNVLAGSPDQTGQDVLYTSLVSCELVLAVNGPTVTVTMTIMISDQLT